MMTRQLQRWTKVGGALLAAGVGVFFAATAMAGPARSIVVEKHLTQQPVLQHDSSPVQTNAIALADVVLSAHPAAESLCQVDDGGDPPQDDSGGGIDNGGEEERGTGAIHV